MLYIKRFVLFTLFSIIIIYTLLKTGHLSTSLNISMINAYLSFSDYDFSICYIFGCASNIIILTGQSEFGVIEDNGFVRLFYTFGILWFIGYSFLCFRVSRDKLLTLGFFVTILHYPVSFGLLGTCLMATNNKFEQ